MDQEHLRQAVRACEMGGVIAYPTEAVYGLGCLPMDERAVKQILALKQRVVEKGLIVVAASIEQIEPYIDFSQVPDRQMIEESWPGPYTWLIPARESTPNWLTGQYTSLAVRVSANPTVKALCSELGPITSTSANPQGKQPAKSSKEVEAYFTDKIDYILPGNITADLKPSQIRDGISGNIVRAS